MYYPKSQITTGLSTDGNDFMLPDGTPYAGKYYKTSDGSFYSGENPNDKPIYLLSLRDKDNRILNSQTNPIPISQTRYQPSIQSEPYSNNMYIIDDGYYNANPKLWDRGDAPRPPQQSFPTPKDKNYENGFFHRYFTKKNNEHKFIEISKKEHDIFLSKSPTVEYSLYTCFSIRWKLNGLKLEAYNINKKTVALKERRGNFPGFTNSFQNKFDKYWVGRI